MLNMTYNLEWPCLHFGFMTEGLNLLAIDPA